MKTNTKMAKVSKTVQGALDFARALGETQFSGEKTRKEVLAYAKARSCYRRGFGKTCGSKLYGKREEYPSSFTGRTPPVGDARSNCISAVTWMSVWVCHQKVRFAQAFRVFGGTDNDAAAILLAVRGKYALFTPPYLLMAHPHTHPGYCRNTVGPRVPHGWCSSCEG